MKLHDYLKEQSEKAPPGSLLGKAIHYALNQWPELLRYMEHGMYKALKDCIGLCWMSKWWRRRELNPRP